MIKITELRIGNWLSGKFGIAQVEPLDFKFNIMSLSANPIPLTNEILERCGFVKSIGWHSAEFMKWQDPGGIDFCISLKAGRYGIESVSNDEVYIDFDIMHLHQLQNLIFALTGKEIEYKQDAQ